MAWQRRIDPKKLHWRKFGNLVTWYHPLHYGTRHYKEATVDQVLDWCRWIRKALKIHLTDTIVIYEKGHEPFKR